MNPMTPMTSSAGDPRRASRSSPMSPASDVEHRREAGHLAERHEAVLDDPRAAAELGRGDVGVVGALGGVEDVVRDVQPELDERRADDGQDGASAGRTSPGGRRSRCRGRPARSSRCRNGRRVVRRASQPNESFGLTGVPRSTDRASKYRFDWPIDRSEYSKNGTSASSQPHARAAANDQRWPPSAATPPGPRP